jgi:hypothetical protein
MTAPLLKLNACSLVCPDDGVGCVGFTLRTITLGSGKRRRSLTTADMDKSATDIGPCSRGMSTSGSRCISVVQARVFKEDNGSAPVV